MPESTGVQPFKRKQREEGKGRIETAGGPQKRAIDSAFDIFERRQAGKASTQAKSDIIGKFILAARKDGRFHGRSKTSARRTGRHGTVIGFRTEACEPGQNRRLPHWAFGKSPHDATSVAVPLLSPFRGAVSVCAKKRLISGFAFKALYFIRGSSSERAPEYFSGGLRDHSPPAAQQPSPEGEPRARASLRKPKNERKGTRWASGKTCCA